MTDMILTGTDAQKTSIEDDKPSPVAPKRARTSEDFYLFCKFILEYENYEDCKDESDQQTSVSPYNSGIAVDHGARLSESAAHTSGSGSAVTLVSLANANEDSVAQLKSNKSLALLNEGRFPTPPNSSERADGRTVLHSRPTKLAKSSSESIDDEASTASPQDWRRKGIHLSDKKSYGLITCFCKRPYAGRPMIECSRCLTWMHLSCVKIKKSNIPDVFFCTKCKKNMRSKNSVHTEQSRAALSRQK